MICSCVHLPLFHDRPGSWQLGSEPAGNPFWAMSCSQFAPFETPELIDKWMYGIRQDTLYSRIAQTDLKRQSDPFSSDHLRCPEAPFIKDHNHPGIHVLSTENSVAPNSDKDKNRMHNWRKEDGEGRTKRRCGRPHHSLSAFQDENLSTTQPAKYQNHAEIAHPSDKYARRQRHRTRGDRYELGNNLPRSKPRRKLMAGEHTVNAWRLEKGLQPPNKRTNRLSLKSGRGPGIFDHVKTSTRMHRHDLPDLAFSDMEFLKKKPSQFYSDRHQKTMMSPSLYQDRTSSRSQASWSSYLAQQAPFPRRQGPAPPASPPFGNAPPIRECRGRRESPPMSPESFVTSRVLQDWATNALLQGIESYSPNSKKQCYSLDDLKALAQDRQLSSASHDPCEGQTSHIRPARRGLESSHHATEYQVREKVAGLPHKYQQRHFQAPYLTIENDNLKPSAQKLSPTNIQGPKQRPQSVHPEPNTIGNNGQPDPSNLTVGPEYSHYWPSPGPNETLGTANDLERDWLRQPQVTDSNDQDWALGEQSFLQTTYDDTHDSQGFDNATLIADIVSQDSQVMSDGLDEFDLQLMQTDPINFPPLETLCTSNWQHQAGGQQEKKNNREVSPFPGSTVSMTEPADAAIDGDAGYQVKPRWHWGRSVIQSNHHPSRGTTRVPELPQHESPSRLFLGLGFFSDALGTGS